MREHAVGEMAQAQRYKLGQETQVYFVLLLMLKVKAKLGHRMKFFTTVMSYIMFCKKLFKIPSTYENIVI